MRDDFENSLGKAISIELDQAIVTEQRRNDIVKNIIKQVREPIKRGLKDDLSENIINIAVDLSDHEESLRELFDRCLGVYRAERDLLKDKLDKKYHETLKRNYEVSDTPDYDYSNLVDKGHNKTVRDAWNVHYQQNYQLGDGPPGIEPRPRYLEPMWNLIGKWWQQKQIEGHEKFDPDFYGSYPELEEMNSAARLFVLIALECDERYTSNQCANLHRSIRREEQKRQNSEVSPPKIVSP